MIDNVLYPSYIIINRGVNSVFLFSAATITETSDALNTVGGSSVSFGGAHEATAAVSRTGVGSAGVPSSAQHVVAD